MYVFKIRLRYLAGVLLVYRRVSIPYVYRTRQVRAKVNDY